MLAIQQILSTKTTFHAQSFDKMVKQLFFNDWTEPSCLLPVTHVETNGLPHNSKYYQWNGFYGGL